MAKLTEKLPLPKTPRRSSRQSKYKAPQIAQVSVAAARQRKFWQDHKSDAAFREKNKEKCVKYRAKLKVKGDKNAKVAADIKKKERLRKAAYRTKIREKEIADKVIEGKRNTGRSSIPISSMCSDSDSDDELHKITELTTKVTFTKFTAFIVHPQIESQP